MVNTDIFLNWVVWLMLIVVRISVLFVVCPLLSRQAIPSLAKIMFSVLLGFILINLVPPPATYEFTNLFVLAFAVLREAIVGLIMGFVTVLFFNIVYTAGHIIDMQIGFSMAQIFDASIGGQSAVSASLLNVVLMTSFIFSDGVNKLVYMLGKSFEYIPVNSAVLRPELGNLMIDLFARCFVLAIQVAMPVLASSLLTEVALGVIVRTAPQMNVFVVGIPIKVIVGLVILAVMLPSFVAMTDGLFDQMFAEIDKALTNVAPTVSS